ncbi:polysaccharide lyase family 7 protein [uncultured Psychromonas sp.]|uniref:polysaccharide lyase family 7 protein n=1 Tax=uncultured Psychromonas sp. TaxID=173974 RepID=UPI00262CE067|nr:polysaccharide lyase family 7 protein [uncultured Psychromonas sp.]
MKHGKLSLFLSTSIAVALSGCATTTDEPTGPINLAGTQAALTVVATESSVHDGNGPDRLIDGDISTRWSASGDNAYATLDYGQVAEFDAVRIAFSKGHQRASNFDILVSEDGKTWTTVLEGMKSSGKVTSIERFPFTAVKARYIKYVGHGNTKNMWNSVTEFYAVNCAVNTCLPNEFITDDVIAANAAENKILDKAAKAKKAKEKAKMKALRLGDFGTHVPLKCDSAVSDCSKKTWWDVPLKSPTIPAVPLAGNKPGENFDLTTWYLSQPFDHDKNGKPDNVDEWYLNQGYEQPELFYTGDDGGLVIKTFIKGTRTSKNTKYTRTEMREMLRRGDKSISTKGVNKNNWVFGSAPESDLEAAGGVDGTLDVTMKVDHTTSTGELGQVGRFIIGQIHDQDDEPIRLYYRKLPNRDTGSVYFAHENTLEGSDNYFSLVGDLSGEVDDGIALGEVFSYQIKVEGNTMTVTVKRDGKDDAVQVVDMSKSGYDQGGRYMYFKVGAYNQNNSGDPEDFVQATFYKIKTSHDEYKK